MIKTVWLNVITLHTRQVKVYFCAVKAIHIKVKSKCLIKINYQFTWVKIKKKKKHEIHNEIRKSKLN